MKNFIVFVFLAEIAVANGVYTNVIDYLQQNNYTTLYSLIQRAGLIPTLSTGGPYTIFAPTDKAIASLPADVFNKIDGDPQFLMEVLTGHVSKGLTVTPMLVNGSSITTLAGTSLNATEYANGRLVLNGVEIRKNMEEIAGNGVVYKIDKVLLPVTKSITEYLATHDSQFSDLYVAMVLEHLDKPLEGGEYTVFAPVDQAFMSILNNLPDLISNDRYFQDLLKFHVVPSTLFSAGMVDGMKLHTVQGSDLTIAVDNTGVYVDNAKVVTTDIATTNGVIHVIDDVLAPPRTK